MEAAEETAVAARLGLPSRRGSSDDGWVDSADRELARQVAERTKAEGLTLTGPSGLLGAADQGRARERSGGRNARPPGVCQA
jgi:hypothetical protein